MSCRPATYWSAAAVLTIGTAAWVHHTESTLAASEAAGELRSAWVATTDVTAGSFVDGDGFERRDLPASILPDAAITSDRPAAGRLRRDVRRGEILGADAVSSTAASALAATIEENERALAIPVTTAALAVEPGDLVDVVALTGRGDPDVAAASVVAERARVLATDGSTVTVAVGSDEVARVSDGLAVGHVTLALRGG